MFANGTLAVKLRVLGEDSVKLTWDEKNEANIDGIKDLSESIRKQFDEWLVKRAQRDDADDKEDARWKTCL